MCKVQMLRALVKQRLTAAAQEIFGLFERTIAEYEEELSASKEENERQRRLLDKLLHPEVRLHRAADVQQLLVVKEEVPPEQQDWISSLEQEDPEPPHIKEDQEDPEPPHIKEDKEDPEPPHIKEEQEELWTSQEGEQLQGLEEAGIKFSFTPVKSEDDEEEAQSSQLHQRLTEHMETEADGEDCGGPELDRNSDPGVSSETEVSDVDDDWKETRGPRSGLNSLNNGAVEKLFSCIVCKKSFRDSGYLRVHMRIHTGEKPFSCTVCEKSFRYSGYLQRHMRIHTGEKPFSCSVCEKSFTWSEVLKKHMRIHTGEKLFSCSVCKKYFRNGGYLRIHMRIHTGEKPFSCSFCEKSFTNSQSKQRHMIIHTGEKTFSCLFCDERFIRKVHLQRHMVTHRNHSAAAGPAR